MNLKEKLKKLSYRELFFTDLTPMKDKDGKMIAVLQLETPIALVRGTQEVEYEGKMRPMIAKDVVEVKVHEDNMTDDFDFAEEGTSGSYKGSNLILDVAKGTGVVWLVKTTLAQSGNNFRANLRNNRLAKIFGGATQTTNEEALKNEAKPPVKPVDLTPAGEVKEKPKK